MCIDGEFEPDTINKTVLLPPLRSNIENQFLQDLCEKQVPL